MTRRDIPNIISVGRILLTIPVVMLMREENFAMALILFAVAGASDGIDGYLAKRNGWESRLGSILDPIADKLLLVSSFLVLALLGYLPVWLVLVVFGRDIIILGGATAYHRFIGNYDLKPTIVSKINTFTQIILVITIMFSLSIYSLPEWMLVRLIDVVFATTVISGLDYIWTWGRSAMNEYKNKADVDVDKNDIDKNKVD